MTKEQAITQFWRSFGWNAYDENTVPREDAQGNKVEPPYITFQMVEGDFGSEVALTASLWDRSNSWARVTDKKDEISVALTLGGTILQVDGGAIWLKKATPFAQRMADEDDTIRRILLNLSAEFITAD